VIAGAWASLVSIGRDGFLMRTKAILDEARRRLSFFVVKRLVAWCVLSSPRLCSFRDGSF
jgi:hypothetical protein